MPLNLEDLYNTLKKLIEDGENPNARIVIETQEGDAYVLSTARYDCWKKLPGEIDTTGQPTLRISAYKHKNVSPDMRIKSKWY